MAKTQYKIDLHSHSIISYDGGLTAKQYTKLLDLGILDCIAITDHDETSFARIMHDQLGGKIIVGEEIMTTDGEIIGLFLQKTIPKGMSAIETVEAIHEQDGIVYIPHLFETLRKGLKLQTLEIIKEFIDIIEVFNGRSRFREKSQEAQSFADSVQIATASSSDAHCYKGAGTSFSIVKEIPERNSMIRLLKSGELQKKHAPLYTLLCPSVNKIKNKLVLGV